jgi:hypothetical protein
MIRFYCRCGTEIFFENSHCAVCGTVLGFDPKRQNLLALQAHEDNIWFSVTTRRRYRLCSLRQELGCNWLIPDQRSDNQCLSCRLTRTIPTLALQRNHTRWQRLEQTKRRALYTILRLGLAFNGPANGSRYSIATQLPPLVFDFLEDQQSNPEVTLDFVYSGHSNGVITINAAEADDSFRATNRELMNEIYRTLLGHFRHELGHYYGLLLKNDDRTFNEYRQLFGDETQDYKAALERYYAEGAGDDWRESFISAYATAHPQEDWAETWAHYLHIRDTLETARDYQVIQGNSDGYLFEQDLSEWAKLAVVLNALNRSMGVDDAYPFVITPIIGQKLHFIDLLVKAWQVPGHNAAGQ